MSVRAIWEQFSRSAKGPMWNPLGTNVLHVLRYGAPPQVGRGDLPPTGQKAGFPGTSRDVRNPIIHFGSWANQARVPTWGVCRLPGYYGIIISPPLEKVDRIMIAQSAPSLGHVPRQHAQRYAAVPQMIMQSAYPRTMLVHLASRQVVNGAARSTSYLHFAIFFLAYHVGFSDGRIVRKSSTIRYLSMKICKPCNPQFKIIGLGFWVPNLGAVCQMQASTTAEAVRIVTSGSNIMSDQPKMIYLPDTMANWPWPRAINPHHEEVKAESDAWFEGFKPFTKQSQVAFDKCDFGRLASLAYPWASKEHLRTGCDLMNVFFVIDEYTDVECASVVRGMVDIVIDAINNPHKPRPEGECLLGEMTRQFWERAIKTATPSSQKHFIEAFTDYLNSVVEQAADRDNNHIRTVDSYLKTRRENIGARPSYFPAELGLNLPDEAFYHPDIASYNKEQATGDDRHNILTIVMHQFNIDLEAAMTWVASYHKDVENKFLDGMKELPSFGPVVDKELEEYILALAIWPRTNDCWNFESGRYFGSKGLQVQKTRYVPLLPKVKTDPTLKQKQVVVSLVDL
ncbi:hypothetical protein IEO21_08705 [Rhodonia placenta]|uniref:Terpene synthase n=1 Tax=Rhodonia placenta TaxID=104341 RepID=A0A8H7TZ52_9APHY|nr:hypothetical protein IEO21_08705 [Postia placenta]